MSGGVGLGSHVLLRRYSARARQFDRTSVSALATANQFHSAAAKRRHRRPNPCQYPPHTPSFTYPTLYGNAIDT